MKRLVTILTLATTLVAFNSPATGESKFQLLGRKSIDNFFLVDHSAFNSLETGRVRLEVYYQIYNAALTFYRHQTDYVADYEISVVVYGKNDLLEDSFSQTRQVRVLTDETAKSEFDYRTNQVNFDLEPGKYEVKLLLSDANSSDVLERKFKVKLEWQNKKNSRLSDIQLVQAISPVGDEPSKFDKGGYTLVPSVSHKYGAEEALKLMFYFEVYQGNSEEDSVAIEMKLRHETKGMLYRDTLTSEVTDGVLRQFREISVDNLRPGEFRLDVTLKGRRDRVIDSKAKYFELVWSEQSQLMYDYESIVNQLSLISLPGEIKELKAQETYDDRVAAFNDFWASRDPSPGTRENENKNEFYHRVHVANQMFSYLRRAGWKTDRGRVYILYGEPDQVEDYPFELNQLPHQEWHYYRDARYRKFVFIDETGDGDFRLIPPYDGLIGPEDN
ncbi:MAG: GWxTD domain-containing protein [Candidatus Zixiibacteriota bacterium]|nr:MAG: GWxTD domain-containing protein [candidate division Zixibacteria bacterium]